MAILQDVIERYTFYSDETGYAIARLEKGATAVGNLPGVSVGETVKLSGDWITHPQYGKQFKIDSFSPIYPVTVSGIVKYLGSGLIKGIGPVTSERIVTVFKEKTLEIIENDIKKLAEVNGVGKKRMEMIARGWEEQKAIKDVMLFLQSNNVSATYAVKIYKTYKDQSIQIVNDNPYQLTYDIWGIGFRTADKIAENMGINSSDPRRIRAGIIYVLSEATNNGHVYLPMDRLITDCVKILEVDLLSNDPAFNSLETDELIIRKDDRVYLPALYYAEKGIASGITRILEKPIQVDQKKLKSLRLQRDYYSDEQLQAIRGAALEKMLIITGGPGTGKTTTLQGIIDVYKQLRKRILLAAPTGRAAKRMAEVVGLEAKTIHRLLEFSPKDMTFKQNADNPLQTDLLVIDEGSMIDTVLMNNLVKAVATDTTLIIVGDIDQLPSVGAGNVMKDLIDSEKIPVTILTKIFRQAQQSRIITNAHRINSGKFPDITVKKNSDFFFIEEDDVEKIPNLILELVKTRLPKKYGFDPMQDIQILTPMYRGESGALNLNELLQSAINLNTNVLTGGGKKFKVGDKVMQLVNNYDKEVFNGDVGYIENFNFEDQIVSINFDQRIVEFDFSDLGELTLAYAVSVHKSQGSEYPCVILPMTTQHYMMLQRNLFYTAVTRARKLMIIIGMKKAIVIAVKNDNVGKRYTSLLKDMIPE